MPLPHCQPLSCFFPPFSASGFFHGYLCCINYRGPSLSISKLPDVLDSYDDSLDDEQKDGNSNNDDKESNENSNSDDKESNGNSNSNDNETE